MQLTLPRGARGDTRRRQLLVGGALVRIALGAVAIPLAPTLYRDHVAALVFLRPTKEVLLFAGFVLRRADASLPAIVACALPILLGGVWVFFGLGKAYGPELDEGDLPGIAGRLLPKKRIERVEAALERGGQKTVFLARLAAFPSSLVAAGAGAAGVRWRRFLVADTVGALTSMVVLLAAGFVLGEAYESAGPWVTAVGGAVAVGALLLLRHHLDR